jgi:hypothetical protein
MKRLALAVLGLVTVAPAAAQVPPYVYAYTLGTASVSVLPANPLRRRLMLINPNATAMVAVCPAGPTRSLPSNPVVAKIGGAGCDIVLPYGMKVVDGSMSPGPVLDMRAAWVAIADTAGSALTVWEFE